VVGWRRPRCSGLFWSLLGSLSLYSPDLPGSEVNYARVGSWRGSFVMSWLGGDIFPCGMMRWTAADYHRNKTRWHLTGRPCPLGRPTCNASSGLIMVVVGSACWGKGSFLRHRYLMEGLSSLIPICGILHTVNGFLLGSPYPLVVS
jgi:hypothetical protein